MTPFYKLFNGCGCAKCEADDAQSADTKIVNDYDTKIVNDYEGDDDEEVENTGYRSAMSAMRNSRLATLSESVFGTEDDPNSLEGLAEVGKKIKEKKIHQGPGAVASFLNVEGEDEELENRGVAALFNSQPCGDSHIPDSHQCHAGQGAAPASRDTADRQSNERSLSQKHEERYIASTILDQIKATDRAALMAWGTRNPTIMPAGKVGEDGYQRGGVQFKVNGGKLGHGVVKVRLMANDTYMVETGKVRTGQWKPQGKRDGVYADNLMETIDHMVERDRPGYANRYHAALEAMVNAGTSEGAKKGWEARRGEAEEFSQKAEQAEASLRTSGEKYQIGENDRLAVAQIHDRAGRKWIELAAQHKSKDRAKAIEFWQKGNSHFRRAGGETVSFGELSNSKPCGDSHIAVDKTCGEKDAAAKAQHMKFVGMFKKRPVTGPDTRSERDKKIDQMVHDDKDRETFE